MPQKGKYPAQNTVTAHSKTGRDIRTGARMGFGAARTKKSKK
jgi:hypothetical protein